MKQVLFQRVVGASQALVFIEDSGHVVLEVVEVNGHHRQTFETLEQLGSEIAGLDFVSDELYSALTVHLDAHYVVVKAR